MNSVTYKRCTKCGEVKLLDNFYVDNRNRDGRHSFCKQCSIKAVRNWEKNNLEKLLERWRRISRERDHKNEAHRAKYKKYRDSHLEKERERIRLKGHNRLAKIKGNGGKITAVEWSELKRKYDYTCLCCRRKEPEIELTLDHVIPVDKGGANVIGNAQPLCGSCNSSKGTKCTDYR
jgi:5-methylcytosine-specific restriction endonuclease McrA